MAAPATPMPGVDAAGDLTNTPAMLILAALKSGGKLTHGQCVLPMLATW